MNIGSRCETSDVSKCGRSQVSKPLESKVMHFHPCPSTGGTTAIEEACKVLDIAYKERRVAFFFLMFPCLASPVMWKMFVFALSFQHSNVRFEAVTGSFPMRACLLA